MCVREEVVKLTSNSFTKENMHLAQASRIFHPAGARSKLQSGSCQQDYARQTASTRFAPHVSSFHNAKVVFWAEGRRAKHLV